MWFFRAGFVRLWLGGESAGEMRSAEGIEYCEEWDVLRA